MIRSLRLWIALALIATMPAACGDSASSTNDGAAIPDGGAAAPDDDTAWFPGDEVHELTLVFTAAAWRAEQDDLTAQLGPFGQGGGLGRGDGGIPGGGGIPQEAIDACAGKAAGDACSVMLFGMRIDGTCSAGLGPALVCAPQGFGGDGGIPGGGIPGGGGALLARDPVVVEVTATYRGQTARHAGFRFKGNSSLAASWTSGISKMPFRITTDAFDDQYPETKKQRLFGRKKLTFSPGWSDASYLRDRLAAEILADRGVPTARTSFIAVTIDRGDGKPVYAGLYTCIEDPDDGMMQRVYGDGDGNLYKPEGSGADWTQFDMAGFVKKNNEAAADYGDVKAAIAALHADRSDAAAWRAGLEKTFDVDGFLRWLAVNTVMVSWDAYGQMAHNYYLYGVPSNSGRLHWIPWDHNMSLTSAGFGMGGIGGTVLSIPLDEVTSRWPLIRFLLDDPVYRARYKEDVQRAGAGAFERARFAARVRALHDLIAPWVTGVHAETAPWTQLSSTQSFDGSVDELAAHARSRAAAVADALAKWR